MKRWAAFLLLFSLFSTSSGAVAASEHARNVVLFLGDAGGIPTLHAASVYRHGHSQKLFIQRLPHIGLMDTSTASQWVTDSAAGMTAIVTGQKTHNGVISQSSTAVRGVSDGAPLKTILEYAEERGLATGVISNVSMADATPAACYAHANDRRTHGEIFSQILKPRFGDGVDLVIGAGRKRIYEEVRKLGIDLDAALRAKDFAVCDTLDSIPPEARRVVALFDNPELDLAPITSRAIDILSANPKGFFLMVECDMHASPIERGLEHALLMDRLVQMTAERLSPDTLVLFTADHSYDLRMRGGLKGRPILAPPPAPPPGAKPESPSIRMENAHTGEQVLVAATGPGAERVHGYLENTDIFRIMLAAFGWREESPAP